MPQETKPIDTPIRRFLKRDGGVATVDWVVMSAGAIGLAILALNLGNDTATTYSEDVRDEIQTPYFDSSWTENDGL